MNEEMLGLLRNLIHPHAPIWSWNLDRRRSSIKISFYDIKSAEFIKEALEREPILGCTPRISFAPPMNTSPPPPQYLELPKSDRLFFISPPPSPPHDWEMRNEEPPNTDTHAHDLAEALAILDKKRAEENSIKAAQQAEMDGATGNRARSSSVTVVYHPGQHGSDLALPAISVEDTEAEICASPVEESLTIAKGTAPKTERPPVD
jgi:Calcipressin